MERHFGLPLEVRAADQLQRIPPSAHALSPQPLPSGSPGRASAESVGILDEDPLTFLLGGDVGGVVDPNPQLAVSAAMQQQAATGTKSASCIWWATSSICTVRSLSTGRSSTSHTRI